MLSIKTTILALLISASIITLSSAQAIDEVVDKLMEAQTSVRSYSIRMKMRESLVSILGRVQTSGTYSYDWVRKGDGFIFRQEQTMRTKDDNDGSETKSKWDNIYDGKIIYGTSDNDGKLSAYKTKAEIASPLDAKKQFATLATENKKKMKVLPDEKVDDRDCYVIEELNTGEFAGFEKGSISYYCKKTGIKLKSVDLNLAGEVIRERIVTDLTVNKDIPPERFEFKPPPGVEVVDLTQNSDE